MEQPQFNRKAPLVILVAVVAILALHHWYVMSEGRAFFAALFLLPPFGMLALGGLIYPPILWSIGKYGKDLPAGIKAIGIALVLAGLGVGFYLFKFVYGF